MHFKALPTLLFACSLPAILAEFTEESALKYLKQYGYIHSNTTGESDHNFQHALMDFQNLNGLQQTGRLDQATENAMKTPRCGVKDYPSLQFQSNQQGIQSQRGPGKWGKKKLTYRVIRYSTSTKISNIEVDETCRKAMDLWEEAADIKFQQTPTGKVDIEISFATRDHDDRNFHGEPNEHCGRNFDGRGGELAHASPPPPRLFPACPKKMAGDIHIDDDEEWSVTYDEGTDLLHTVAHEVGHSLGLGHSKGFKKGKDSPIMHSDHPGWVQNLILHQDDIERIQALYGSSSQPVSTPRQSPTGTSCDASNWPDLDHGLTCGDCKALINKMSSKYITCNDYCKSIDRSCSGAWEESDDSCKVQSTETCTHRFTYTSDAICECGPTLSGTSCDVSNWPDLDHGLTCGDCKALINKMNSKYITCKDYCKSLDRSCSGAWEESDDSCKVQSTETCTHRFTYTSDAICECGPTLSGPICDASNWPDLDHGLTCGDCKALINKMSSKYITCKDYCKSIDRSCSGAWEESDDSCKVQSTETCTHRFTYTSDAICECDPTLSGGRSCDASNWPDLDHGLTCGGCKALIKKMNSKYITCKDYCKSIDRSCSGAWEESGDSCKVQSTETCTHRFTYTSDAICECGPAISE